MRLVLISTISAVIGESTIGDCEQKPGSSGGQLKHGFDISVEHFHVLGSTQTYIKELKLAALSSNASPPQLIVVSAEHQTHGRGKGNRKWFSDESSKCLALSFAFLVPENRLKDCPILTQLLALAVMKTFPDIDLLMKWPNDLIVVGKKVGGILAELEPMGDGTFYALIIGVGVNLDIDQTRLDSLQSRWPATSLARFIPPNASINFFETRDKIIENFSNLLSIFLSKDDESLSCLVSEISRRQFLLGQYISFQAGDQLVQGIHSGIDDNGGLKIFSNSILTTFHSGEIVLERVT